MSPEVSDVAEFLVNDQKVLVLGLEDWDPWVPEFEAIRVLRSAEYTDYEYIFLVSLPYLDKLVEDDSFTKYVHLLHRVAKRMIKPDED